MASSSSPDDEAVVVVVVVTSSDSLALQNSSILLAFLVLLGTKSIDTLFGFSLGSYTTSLTASYPKCELIDVDNDILLSSNPVFGSTIIAYDADSRPTSPTMAIDNFWNPGTSISETSRSFVIDEEGKTKPRNFIVTSHEPRTKGG